MGRQPSAMQHNFARVPAPDIQRSVFQRNKTYKTTFDSGYLIPFYVEEILPGDTLSLRAQIFARIATLLFPIMDNMYIDTHYFFCPNRLVWDNWERFNGAQTDPGDSTDFLIPQVGTGEPGSLNFSETSVADYFGLPTQVQITEADKPSALPFRMHNLIWNEWYRDQNMQDSLPVPTDDGPDDQALYNLMKRGKRHDYFTSCLPWPQKGDSVELPLGLSAPVIGTGQVLGLYNGTQTFGLAASNGVPQPVLTTDIYGDSVGFAWASGNPATSTGVGVTQSAANSGLVADLASATAATVNQLRQAFQFQKILERDARGGTRYVELLKAHFGVTSPDFRLQRPEYLGGSSQPIDVRAIAQTSETSGTSPQANLSAYSTAQSQSGFNKSFVEHGYVLGFISVRADITYQQGMHRMWNRRTRFDFYIPALAHLGEQAVLNKEIYYPDLGTGADGVFGYQERWAEYRYGHSQITGKFRSNALASLDAWHLAQDFGSIPVLNGPFIDEAPPVSRIVAVPDEPEILLDSFFHQKHARPMPVFSVPGQIDRF